MELVAVLKRWQIRKSCSSESFLWVCPWLSLSLSRGLVSLFLWGSHLVSQPQNSLGGPWKIVLVFSDQTIAKQFKKNFRLQITKKN